jgi:hypothetical protein
MWFVLRSLAIFTSSWSKILEPHFLTSAHYKLLHLTTNWEPRLPMSHRWSYLGGISCCWIIQLDGHVYQGLVSRERWQESNRSWSLHRGTYTWAFLHGPTRTRSVHGPYWTGMDTYLTVREKNLDPSVTRNAVFTLQNAWTARCVQWDGRRQDFLDLKYPDFFQPDSTRKSTVAPRPNEVTTRR